MENHVVKKWLKRLSISTNLAIAGILCLAMVVMAAPGLITDLTAFAYSTSIKLNWIPASNSDNTVIRYSTTSFPATPAAGTSAYNGTLSYCTVSDLVAGTTYYFSAWGYDGSDYSASSKELAVTTIAPSSANTTIPFVDPTIPAEAWQDPDSSGWNIEPLDTIFAWFADPDLDQGGLGMPTDNLIMFMAGVGVTGVGLGCYIKWRSFFSAYIVVFILSFFCVGIGVMQGYVIGLEILIGMGVWAVDNSTQ